MNHQHAVFMRGSRLGPQVQPTKQFLVLSLGGGTGRKKIAVGEGKVKEVVWCGERKGGNNME
jgi:hypothetical protein